MIHQPDATGWSGGDCPIPVGIRVELFYRGGDRQVIDITEKTSEWFFRHTGDEMIRGIIAKNLYIPFTEPIGNITADETIFMRIIEYADAEMRNLVLDKLTEGKRSLPASPKRKYTRKAKIEPV